MVKLRLKRLGKRHYPIYKIVAADSRFPRDGRFIEAVGTYNPNLDPMEVTIKEERVKYWLGVGAQPTDTVRNILKSEGLILKLHLEKKGAASDVIESEVQKFLGDKESKENRSREKKVRRKLNKKSKKDVKDQGDKKAEEPKAEEVKVEEPKAEEIKAEVPKTEEPKAEEVKAEVPKTEEPKAEEVKAEVPKAEEPKAPEAPAAETNAPETPKAE